MSLRLQRLLLVTLFVMLAFLGGRWSVHQRILQHVDKNISVEKQSTQQELVEKPKDLLEIIKEKKRLDVVMVNGPTTYFVGATGKEGFEYLLMKHFAKHLGVALQLHGVSTVKEALELTKKGVGEMTSGALTRTAAREKSYVFGPNYFSVKEEVVCHQRMIRNKTFPRSLEDLVGLNIVVGENTSYVQTLESLQKELPELTFSRSSTASTEAILAEVASGKVACTVVDSNIFDINNRYFPGLRRAFSVSENKPLAWILRAHSEDLNRSLTTWLNQLERSGEMARLKDHYYGLNKFNYVNLATFHKRIKSRLPKYKKIFQKAGKKYDIPWTLLAAQSYQESHWDRLAKSPTGVRGLMMLTQVTAKEVGIKNRLNATSSIYGGAKYFRSIYNRISDEVQGIERYKLAYAAYNVGMGHLLDARALARKQGKNPNSWKDLKSVLPLLSQRKYYRHLKYGYARGQEPVDYVEAIYEYHVILENHYKKKVKSEK